MKNRRLFGRIALVGAAALVAIVLAACHLSGTHPTGITIYNGNTGTTNQYVYKNVTIDGTVQSPSEITEGTQQNYAVTASSTHTVQFNYVTPTGSSTIGPIPVSVPSSGACLINGPTGSSTTYSTNGC